MVNTNTQRNKIFQVLGILLRESIQRSLDAVIQVDYRETVLAFGGFGPSVSQLFGATSWAHSNPQQADWGRFHERSLALKSVDDSWQVDGAAWLFNAFVLLAGSLYLFGGIAMGKRAGAKPAGPTGGVRILAAARLHPHWAVWEQTAGLAKDGVLFTLARSGVRLGSGMHTPLLEAAVPPPPPPADDDDGGRSGGSRERERRSGGGAHRRRSCPGTARVACPARWTWAPSPLQLPRAQQRRAASVEQRRARCHLVLVAWQTRRRH